MFQLNFLRGAVFEGSEQKCMSVPGRLLRWNGGVELDVEWEGPQVIITYEVISGSGGSPGRSASRPNLGLLPAL